MTSETAGDPVITRPITVIVHSADFHIRLSPWLSKPFRGVPPTLRGVGLTETIRKPQPGHAKRLRQTEQGRRLPGIDPLKSALSQNSQRFWRLVAVVNVWARQILHS